MHYLRNRINSRCNPNHLYVQDMIDLPARFVERLGNEGMVRVMRYENPDTDKNYGRTLYSIEDLKRYCDAQADGIELEPYHWEQSTLLHINKTKQRRNQCRRSSKS